MQKPIVEKVFEYKGYKCAVLFQPMGHRCGYVKIPKESKYFHWDYEGIPIDVHGGFTYSRNYLVGVEETNNDTWWIGWDYAHCYDRADMDSCYKYYEDLNPYMWFPDEGKIYYQEDVETDCKYVVEQLIKLEKQEVKHVQN